MSNRFNNIGAIRSITTFNATPEEEGGPCRYNFAEAVVGCLTRAENYINSLHFDSGEAEVPADYSINAHPRYGKSDLARCISICALHGAEINGVQIPPMASAVLFLVPYGNLVGQFIDTGKGFGINAEHGKWKKAEKRYGLICRNGKSAVELIGRRELDAKRDGRYSPDDAEAINALDHTGSTHIIGSTVQLVKSRLGVFTAWIRRRVEEDPMHRPVFVFWDEIQSIAQNKWAKVYEALTEAGAFNVGMTGTITRDDGLLVSSVRRKVDERKEYDKKIFLGTRPAEEGKVWVKRRVDKRERRTYLDEADITISPAIGYERGYLCEVNTFFYDVEMEELRKIAQDDNSPGRMDLPPQEDLRATRLSELSESAAKSLIGRLVRNPHIAKALLTVGLSRLDAHIPFLPDGRMIVFCCSDEPVGASKEEAKRIEKEADKHLKQIEKWIVELRPDLKGSICHLTGNKLDESGEKLSRAMAAFERSDQRVVLVKAMGNAGWDFPSLCVAVDLSPTRAEVTKAQAIFRPQTVKYDSNGDKYLRCDLVMLADPMNKRIVAKYIQDQGGEASTATALIQKGAEYERKETLQDPRAETEYLVGTGRSAVITDQDSREVTYDRQSVIAEKLVARPGSAWTGLTVTKATEMLAALPGGFEAAEQAIGAPVSAPSLAMDRDDLRAGINHWVAKTVGGVMSQLPTGMGARFPEVMGIAHNCLRDISAIPASGVKLADLPTDQLEELHRTSQTIAFKDAVLAETKGFYAARQEVAA